MKVDRSTVWRVFFVLSATFILAGGPQHPAGTTEEMLASPVWVRSHALLLAGFGALLIGLILFPRGPELPARTRRWIGYAIAGSALQCVEMVFHTAASVDHAHLVAGDPTPILTTHFRLAIVAYPVFGLTFAGLVIASTRDRVLGSRRIAWLGVAGAVAHGAAAPLVVLFGIQLADFLFALLLLCALWLLFVAIGKRPTLADSSQP